MVLNLNQGMILRCFSAVRLKPSRGSYILISSHHIHKKYIKPIVKCFPVNKYLESVREVFDLSIKQMSTLKKTLKLKNARKSDFSFLADTPRHLKDLGVTSEDFSQNLEIFTLSPEEMKSRLSYFQESGGISDKLLVTRFNFLVEKPVVALKAAGILPENVNVPETILSNVGLNLPKYIPSVNELSCYREVHWNAALHYLKFYFNQDISEKDLAKVSRLNPVFYINSITCTLNERAKFSKDEILTHLELLNCNPYNLSKMISQETYPYEINICHLLQENPKIAMFDLNNILMNLSIFNKYGVSKEEVLKHINLWGEHPSSIQKRMRTLFSLEDISHENPLDFIGIPNFLTKARHFSKQICKNSELDRSASNTRRKLAKRLPQFLAKELKMNINHVRASLNKHPNWTMTKLRTVVQTLEFLRKQGFQNEDIKDCIVILLYPRRLIFSAMRCISNHKYLSRERLLHLCLYNIEKQNQFTWDNSCDADEDKIPQETIPSMQI